MCDASMHWIDGVVLSFGHLMYRDQMVLRKGEIVEKGIEKKTPLQRRKFTLSVSTKPLTW
jgi:hypothetical protein